MKGTCQNCNTEFNYMASQKSGKFCSNKCQGEYTVKQRFTKGTDFRNSMRTYLVENTEYKCSSCGITEHNNKPIKLQVDHIDGDRKNNEFSNLRFLCPNCHSQTKTWGSGNISEEGRKRLVEAAKKGAAITNSKRSGSSVG